MSNYDAPGPVSNTATAVPVPPAFESPAIDEAEEEAAAAAEAANIGGQVSDYAGPEGDAATEAERPLAEAGQGEAEGQEQTEAELREAAAPTAPGMSDEQRQIEDAIDQAGNPIAPETGRRAHRRRVEDLVGPRSVNSVNEEVAIGHHDVKFTRAGAWIGQNRR